MLGHDGSHDSKLEVHDLCVTYASGSRALTAVSSVSLSVPPGQTLGIVGESGCGKSTLAKAIVGLAPLTSGTIALDGADCTAARKRESLQFRRSVQMVFQDPYGSLSPRMTVGRMLTEVLATHKLSTRRGRQDEAARVLGLVGLSGQDQDKYPHQFSGGQRQRIAIARALCVQPEVVINDEVTSALDASAQATVLNLLKRLQRELRLSYIFISHDLATVRYMSDQIAVMYLGRIVEYAPTAELFAAPRHPYTRALIESIPVFGGGHARAPLAGDIPDPARPPTGCRFHTRCPVGPVADLSRQICRESDPQAGATDRPHRAACHFASTKEETWAIASQPPLSSA
jgi:oligopeptide/dipeptide ABC transporter ATP-binding protein